MRTLLIMAVLAPLSAVYAAPVPEGGERLSINEDGELTEPPWLLIVEDDAALPDGLSIGGQLLAHLEVHPTGIVILNGDGFDAAAPRPLDELVMESAIAPFWATLAPGMCGDRPAGTVSRVDAPDRLTIVWQDAPLVGCEADGETATFSVTLAWNEAAIIQRLEFRYEALPSETLIIEPRTGLRLQERGEVRSVFELLPDPSPGRLRGRSKLLLDGSSDGEAGLWIIELGGEGQILGEREPEFFEDDGQTRRRPDGWREADNCPDHFNPLQEDFDGDGRGDPCDPDADADEVLVGDNCPLVPNRGQEDTDRDGAGDACDPDDDDDGWPDELDRCPLHPDPSNYDLDGDGLGDACDFDADGDDEPAWFQAPLRPDTCPFVFDPARKDTDGDGIGDACDLRPVHPCRLGCAWQRDVDGDGVSDPLDICPTVHDPDQVDRDRDGVGDACDLDDDGNGLLDALEVFWRYDSLRLSPPAGWTPPPRLP